MDETGVSRGHGLAFVLTYGMSATRQEPRNVGIALVEEGGSFAVVRHLPPSQLAAHLRAQGILDAALVRVAQMVADDPSQASARLGAMQQWFVGPLKISRSIPTELGDDPTKTLDTLFNALVARKVSRRPGIGRGQLLDKVVAAMRRSGVSVARGAYLDDFLIDAVVTGRSKDVLAIHAQSFDARGRDWVKAEQETAHFLFAMESLKADSVCVIRPPSDQSDEAASRSFERVDRWLNRASIRRVEPHLLPALARDYGTEQLPLVMA